MSDLTTTTQDTLRDKCIELYVGLHSFVDTLGERARENRGQTAAEYMGVLLIVAAVITAVATSAIGDEIRTQAVALVKKIGGTGGEEG